MKPAIVILFALLVIVAGMFLLAKSKKEELGKFFKFISYTVVISGFVIIFIVIQISIIRTLGECRNKFMYFGMHKGFNKEMPCPMPDHKMIMMNEDIMNDGNNIIKKIEIVGDDKCGMMKIGSGNGCGMSTNCIMKMGNDKGCGSGTSCQLKCLSPEERAMVITKRISDKVTLTTEQFTKVQALLIEISKKKEILMKEGGEDPIKIEGLMKKHEQERIDAIKKLLTPAQIKLLPEDLPM